MRQQGMDPAHRLVPVTQAYGLGWGMGVLAEPPPPPAGGECVEWEQETPVHWDW